MNVADLKLFYTGDRLRLTVGEDRSYWSVRPVWAMPLTRPDEFLALIDEKGDEIAMLADPKSLPKASYQVAMEEVRRRYLTARITSVVEARTEFGATYWTVETDRGRREFVTQSLQENAQWLGDEHILLTDVDGNRFELSGISRLDAKSRAIVGAIL